MGLTLGQLTKSPGMSSKALSSNFSIQGAFYFIFLCLLQGDYLFCFFAALISRVLVGPLMRFLLDIVNIEI